VYVDGKKTQTYLIAGALVGFDLPAGKHDITFRYSVPGYTLGLIATIFAALAVAFCLFWRRYRRLHPAPERTKKERKPAPPDDKPAFESKVMKLEDDLGDMTPPATDPKQETVDEILEELFDKE